MNDQLRFALDALAPHGLALKQHILRRLLAGSPEQLTITEVAEGGPRRTDATVRGALRTLDRIGVVRFISADMTGDVARCYLVPGAREAVRSFLRPQNEELRPLSPCLPVGHINRC